MVVAFFFSRIFPSLRGIKRGHGPGKPFGIDHNGVQPFGLTSQGSSDQELDPSTSFHALSDGSGGYPNQNSKRHRKKPFRAMAILTSIASDFDLISDWLFYLNTLKNDKSYREEYQANYQTNIAEGNPPWLIPETLMVSVLVSCILGTITWILLATEGQIITPFLKQCGIGRLSMGFLLFLCVLIEDIPQVVLTFLVEDYYEADQYLSQTAVINLMASLYDTLIKIAESFDQRHDIVETGVWCRETVWAHDAPVTAVLALPFKDASHQFMKSNRVIPPFKNNSQADLFRSFTSLNRSTVPNATKRNSTSRTASEDQSRPSLSERSSFSLRRPFALIESDRATTSGTYNPRIYFLTASMDRNIRLWDTSASPSDLQGKRCLRTFWGHKEAVTCLAWVGTHPLEENSSKLFFLSGSKRGMSKLWSLNGECHRSYIFSDKHKKNTRVNALSTSKNREFFMCAYEKGIVRLWGIWTGSCLGDFVGHSKAVSAVCFLADGKDFVSGSRDTTIRLWCAEPCFQHSQRSTSILDESLPDLHTDSNSTRSSTGISYIEDKPTTIFRGHKAAVVSVTYLAKNANLLSGSEDYTAILWSLTSGLCLRVFRGHDDPILCTVAIDDHTFLTGSNDGTIKAWDVHSAACLRTYEGHQAGITGLSVVDSPQGNVSGSFLSCSLDQCVKIWVLTAVTDLDHMLLIDDENCRCFCSTAPI